VALAQRPQPARLSFQLARADISAQTLPLNLAADLTSPLATQSLCCFKFHCGGDWTAVFQFGWHRRFYWIKTRLL